MSKKMTNHLKDQCDIDDEDEVQEITAARTTMKKKMPVCLTCNQKFASQNGMKKHIQEQHN